MIAPALIAVDTNILVYAHRDDSPFYDSASKILTAMASGLDPWAIPWPCIHEFYSVITASQSFHTPTPIALALDQIDRLIQSPSLVLLTETDQHWSVLRDVAAAARIHGIKIHDAKIAAICLQHGVRELWSADRDFSRFAGLTTVNPLI